MYFSLQGVDDHGDDYISLVYWKRKWFLLLACIDSKDANLVHVRELCNHHDKYSKRVEQQHRMLIVCRVRCYQVPTEQVPGC